MAYEENPTISYAPFTGEAFMRLMLAARHREHGRSGYQP